jgi:SOS-response transcriptional repressor LexA
LRYTCQRTILIDKKNSPLADLVRAWRVDTGRTRLGLSKELNTSKTTVSNWELGVNQPGVEMLSALASLAEGSHKQQFLDAARAKSGLSEQDFREMPSQDVIAPSTVRGEGEAPHQSNTRRVPVMSDAASAGAPRKMSEASEEEIVLLRSMLPRGGDLRGIWVAGDSMSPIVPNGSIVIVNVEARDPEKLMNRMVAARDDHGVTIKWLRRTGSIFALQPENSCSDFPLAYLKPHGDFTIVGEVVKWIGGPPPPGK